MRGRLTPRFALHYWSGSAVNDGVSQVIGPTAGHWPTLHWVAWSYSGGTPDSNAKIFVMTGSEFPFLLNLAGSKEGFVHFGDRLIYGLRAVSPNDLEVTLTAAGVGITGRVSFAYTV